MRRVAVASAGFDLGLAVRFGGGFHFGDPQRWVGEIALVADVTEIVDANR